MNTASSAGDSTAILQLEPDFPAITPTQSLNGWHREFCVELLGGGSARIFVRAVRHSSLKATELRQAVLFHRLDPRFTDLAGCVGALEQELKRLAATARRTVPGKDNLFVTVTYLRATWQQVEDGVDRWARRAPGQKASVSTSDADCAL